MPKHHRDLVLVYNVHIASQDIDVSMARIRSKQLQPMEFSPITTADMRCSPLSTTLHCRERLSWPSSSADPLFGHGLPGDGDGDGDGDGNGDENWVGG